jgi:hypothetical protein
VGRPGIGHCCFNSPGQATILTPNPIAGAERPAAIGTTGDAAGGNG